MLKYLNYRIMTESGSFPIPACQMLATILLLLEMAVAIQCKTTESVCFLL